MFPLRRLGPHSSTVPGKRQSGGGSCAGLLSGLKWSGALPVKVLVLAGAETEALVDTGCTRSIIHASLCGPWNDREVNMVTVSGQRLDCAGTAKVRVQLPGRRAAVVVNAIVVK